MQWLVNVIEQHGLGLVFLNVLIEQLGAAIWVGSALLPRQAPSR